MQEASIHRKTLEANLDPVRARLSSLERLQHTHTEQLDANLSEIRTQQEMTDSLLREVSLSSTPVKDKDSPVPRVFRPPTLFLDNYDAVTEVRVNCYCNIIFSLSSMLDGCVCSDVCVCVFSL